MQKQNTHQPRRALLRLGLGLLAMGVTGSGRAQSRQPPLRVITLFQGATDSAIALGITPCAVVESWTEKPVYHYLRPALQGVPVIGLETQPSLEDIALLQPDVIIASRFRHARIAPLLRQIAPVVMLDHIYEFQQTLALMGEALHRQCQAGFLLARWQGRVQSLRRQLQRRFAGRQTPTVAVLDVREDHLRSYLPASFPGSVLTEVGFDWSPHSRAASGLSLRLTSKESLPVLEADLFFVFLRASKPAVWQHYRELQEHPLWQRMSAPRQGQVRQVNGVAWSLSGGIMGANLMLDDIERWLTGREPA